MFPQTYGTQYYGKRFPIKTEKQVLFLANAVIDLIATKIFLLQLVAISAGNIVKKIPLSYLPIVYGQTTYGTTYAGGVNYQIIPEVAEKKIILVPKIAVTITVIAWIKRQINSLVYVVSNVGVNITKFITFPKPITAICNACTSIKKQANKTFVTVTSILALIYKCKVYDLEFIGPFKPGDIVKINSKTMEVTLNGANVLHLIEKDNFPLIRQGEQIFTYVDNEGERIVKVRMQWKDRWL